MSVLQLLLVLCMHETIKLLKCALHVYFIHIVARVLYGIKVLLYTIVKALLRVYEKNSTRACARD